MSSRQRNAATPEDQAQSLLERLEFVGIPVAVEKIPKLMEAQLRYSPLDDELSGMAYVKEGIAIIGVNSLHHPHRQRFTIAHEIGHLCMHRAHITSSVHVDKSFSGLVLKRDATSAAGTERLEIEANQFAAALLLPRRHLAKMLSETRIDILDEAALEDLAKKFKVSKATLEYRIRNFQLEQTGE
jgi:Zn-dependent peptidase ImmA (M78 family)